MSRKIARESAFRTVYSKLFDASFDGFEASNDINNKCDINFYNDLCSNFSLHYDEITNQIKAQLKGVVFERVYKVDLALIYLALTELDYFDTPKKVVINEIIELAKNYSTEKSASFINGFLADFVK